MPETVLPDTTVNGEAGPNDAVDAERKEYKYWGVVIGTGTGWDMDPDSIYFYDFIPADRFKDVFPPNCVCDSITFDEWNGVITVAPTEGDMFQVSRAAFFAKLASVALDQELNSKLMAESSQALEAAKASVAQAQADTADLFSAAKKD